MHNNLDVVPLTAEQVASFVLYLRQSIRIDMHISASPQ